MVAVGRTREYARSLIVKKEVILWRALDFTRRVFGHPYQLGAITASVSYSASACGMYVKGSVQN